MINMGFILSKFRKTKPSIKDSLENINKELQSIGRFQFETEVQQKRIIGRLSIFAFLIYAVAILCYYLFVPTKNFSWKQHALSLLPFVVFPIIIWSLRAFLSWWYQRKIIMNKEKTESLKKEKDRLLEDVMENETFKVAKEILEKYAPRHLLPKYLANSEQRTLPQSAGNSPLSSRISPSSSEGIRRRNFGQAGSLQGRSSLPPMQGQGNRFGAPQALPPGQYGRMPFRPMAAIMGAPPPGPGIRTPGPVMSSAPPGYTPPRFLLPQTPSNPIYHNAKTGWLDKIVDYVVGDGPAYRFALICRYCATHNGLATHDEFPYTGYRCINCRQYNPPKQMRPSAPTLPRNTVIFEELDVSARGEDTSEAEVESNKGDAEAELNTSDQNVDSTANAESEPEAHVDLAESDLRRSSIHEQEKQDIPFVDDENKDQDEAPNSASDSENTAKSYTNTTKSFTAEDTDTEVTMGRLSVNIQKESEIAIPNVVNVSPKSSTITGQNFDEEFILKD